MNLTNYKIIDQEVRHANPKLSQEDRQDLVQDVFVRLLSSGATHITRWYIKRLLRNMRVDKHRKTARRPDIVFDSSLTDKLTGESYEEHKT